MRTRTASRRISTIGGSSVWRPATTCSAREASLARNPRFTRPRLAVSNVAASGVGVSTFTVSRFAPSGVAGSTLAMSARRRWALRCLAVGRTFAGGGGSCARCGRGRSLLRHGACCDLGRGGGGSWELRRRLARGTAGDRSRGTHVRYTGGSARRRTRTARHRARRSPVAPRSRRDRALEGRRTCCGRLVLPNLRFSSFSISTSSARSRMTAASPRGFTWRIKSRARVSFASRSASSSHAADSGGPRRGAGVAAGLAGRSAGNGSVVSAAGAGSPVIAGGRVVAARARSIASRSRRLFVEASSTSSATLASVMASRSTATVDR